MIGRAADISRLKLKIQLLCGDDIAIGPGKADLLDAIRDTGSISAAGRSLGMSYRRAWQLVDVMNRCFRAKLVETHPGGGQKSGASLTQEGAQVLAAFRALAAQLDASAAGDDVARIEQALRDLPLPPAD